MVSKVIGRAVFSSYSRIKASLVSWSCDCYNSEVAEGLLFPLPWLFESYKVFCVLAAVLYEVLGSYLSIEVYLSKTKALLP